jgi:transcriptional regulator with XRE-family HTH domain
MEYVSFIGHTKHGETLMTDLRTRRMAAGLSTVQAAKLLGIGRSTLFRYETDQVQKPDYHLIERMNALYKPCRKSRAGLAIPEVPNVG